MALVQDPTPFDMERFLQELMRNFRPRDSDTPTAPDTFKDRWAPLHEYPRENAPTQAPGTLPPWIAPVVEGPEAMTDVSAQSRGPSDAVRQSLEVLRGDKTSQAPQSPTEGQPGAVRGGATEVAGTSPERTSDAVARSLEVLRSGPQAPVSKGPIRDVFDALNDQLATFVDLPGHVARNVRNAIAKAVGLSEEGTEALDPARRQMEAVGIPLGDPALKSVGARVGRALPETAAMVLGAPAAAGLRGAAALKATSGPLSRLGAAGVETLKNAADYAVRKPGTFAVADVAGRAGAEKLKDVTEGSGPVVQPLAEFAGAMAAGGSATLLGERLVWPMAKTGARAGRNILAHTPFIGKLFSRPEYVDPIRPKLADPAETLRVAQAEVAHDVQAIDDEIGRTLAGVTQTAGRSPRGTFTGQTVDRPSATEPSIDLSVRMTNVLDRTIRIARGRERTYWNQVDLRAPVDSTATKQGVRDFLESRSEETFQQEVLEPLVSRIIGHQPRTVTTSVTGRTTSAGADDVQAATLDRIKGTSTARDTRTEFERASDLTRDTTRTTLRDTGNVLPDQTSVGEMRSLHRHINDLRQAELAGDNRPWLINSYNEIDKIVLGGIQAAYPNNRALARAVTFSRELNERYRSGPLGFIQRMSATGDPRVLPEDAVKTLMARSQGLRQIAQGPDRALLESTEETIRAMFREATEAGIRPGEAPERAAQGIAFIRQQNAAIKQLTRPAAEFQQTGAFLTDLLAQRREATTNALARFTGYGNLPPDPKTAIKTLVNSQNPAEDIRTVIRGMRGDDSAFEGLRQGLIDELFERAGPGAHNLYSIMNEPRMTRALAAAFEDAPKRREELFSLAKAVQTIESAGAKGTGVRRTVLGSLTGASAALGVVEPFTGGVLGAATLVGQFGGAAGGRFLSGLTGQPTIQGPGIVAGAVKRFVHRTLAPIPPNDLFAMAIVDPKMARFLKSRVPETTKELKALEKQARRLVYGLEASRTEALRRLDAEGAEP